MKQAIIFLLAALAITVTLSAQQKALTEDFLKNAGDTVIVYGKIYGGAYLVHVSTKPTFLNLGDTSPNHRLIIRIEPEDRDKFPLPPENYFLNKTVTVTGKLQDYKGQPLIQVSEPAMIKTDIEPSVPTADTNAVVSAIHNANSKGDNENKLSPPVAQSLQAIKPDTLLQSAWIKSVTEKAAEEKKRNIRIVQSNITLRTAPYKDAPVIAELHAGMVVSILYTSKKWSYISIGSVDGFNNVNGFIRHKRFRHLKKAEEGR